uniref:Uncharacterized protein n=1 Tax=Junco hyemalis TaxID=40217 RepID=A0A8C5IZX6_JUNHY
VNANYSPFRGSLLQCFCSFISLNCMYVFFLLHLHLPTHRPRTLLRLISKQRNLKHWSHPPPNPHSNCLGQLKPPSRTKRVTGKKSSQKRKGT